MFKIPEECLGAKLLIFDLFCGMDGLGHSLDLLGTSECFPSQAVCLLFEVDGRCRKLLAVHRVRSGIILSSLRDLEGVEGSALAPSEGSEGIFENILSQLPALQLILLVSGSPCVGFSVALGHSVRTGIRHSQSEKLWSVPVALARLRRLSDRMFSTPVSIVFLAENVDMSERPSDVANRDAISRTMGVEHVLIPASRVCMTERLRSYWTNLRVPDLLPLVLDAGSVLDSGWRPLWEFPSGIRQPDKRFSTFLRPFKPGFPEEFPAPFRRLPLSAYSDRGLVYRSDVSGDNLRLLEDLVVSCVRIKTTNIRVKGSPAILARIRLAEEIHVRGADQFLRPLNGRERDLSLGFPAGASSLPEDSTEGFLWEPLEASGNAFVVPVIAHILQPLAKFLLQADSPLPELLPGFPSVLTREEALVSLTPEPTSGNKLHRSGKSRTVAQ